MNAAATIVVSYIEGDQRLIDVLDGVACSARERIHYNAVAVCIIWIGGIAAMRQCVIIHDVPFEDVTEEIRADNERSDPQVRVRLVIEGGRVTG